MGTSTPSGCWLDPKGVRNDRHQPLERTTTNPNGPAGAASWRMPTCAMPLRRCRPNTPAAAIGRCRCICAARAAGSASGESVGSCGNLACMQQIRKAFVCTTDSRHSHRVYPNLLEGRTVTGIDQVWAAGSDLHPYRQRICLPGGHPGSVLQARDWLGHLQAH